MSIDDHWMKYFYLSNYLAEKNFESEAIILATQLSEVFPNSYYLLNLIANCYYLIHGKFQYLIINLNKKKIPIFNLKN